MEKTASEREKAWEGFLPEIVALPTNGEDSSSGKLFYLILSKSGLETIPFQTGETTSRDVVSSC